MAEAAEFEGGRCFSSCATFVIGGFWLQFVAR
jgi:hypothetical protein